MSDCTIYDEGVELAVLGCLVSEHSTRQQHLDSIVESDFFVPSHRELFREICRTHDRDGLVSVERLANGDREKISLLADAMTQAVPPNVSSYIAILKRESRRRKALGDAQEAIRVAVEEPEKFTDVSVGLRGVSITDLACDVHHDPDELLRHRFLCRGGGAMLNGPTGVGKSSFIMQAAIVWSLGKPFFGIEPARPLTSVIVQAENDDGDLIEQREGCFTGLALSEEEKGLVRERVFFHSENSKTGAAFISGVARPLLREHRPDLLWLDNMFAYCGCNVSDQEKMSLFLRNLINPMIQEYRCGMVIGHHTNKPPTSEQKADWSVSETAYMGSGSGELANWPRAILSIRSLRTEGIFELVAGKRGSRLRWTDAENKTTCRRNIAHSTNGLIFWREPEAEEIESQKDTRSKYDVQKLLVVGQEMAKEALVSKAGSTCKLGVNKTKGFISELVGDGIFRVIEKPRPRTNPAIYLERVL